jgi:hypothetical protein
VITRVIACGVLFAWFVVFAQTPATPKFEVASVKLDSGPFRPPNFPLDASDAYRSVGARFFADFPLTTYITFAYKLSLTPEQTHSMIEHLPT